MILFHHFLITSDVHAQCVRLFDRNLRECVEKSLFAVLTTYVLPLRVNAPDPVYLFLVIKKRTYNDFGYSEQISMQQFPTVPISLTAALNVCLQPAPTCITQITSSII